MILMMCAMLAVPSVGMDVSATGEAPAQDISLVESQEDEEKKSDTENQGNTNNLFIPHVLLLCCPLS